MKTILVSIPTHNQFKILHYVNHSNIINWQQCSELHVLTSNKTTHHPCDITGKNHCTILQLHKLCNLHTALFLLVTTMEMFQWISILYDNIIKRFFTYRTLKQGYGIHTSSQILFFISPCAQRGNNFKMKFSFLIFFQRNQFRLLMLRHWSRLRDHCFLFTACRA